MKQCIGDAPNDMECNKIKINSDWFIGFGQQEYCQDLSRIKIAQLYIVHIGSFQQEYSLLIKKFVRSSKCKEYLTKLFKKITSSI